MNNIREKLVELLCDALGDGCIGHCNHPYCFRVNSAADHLIANGVTVQEWISVKDRLPEEEDANEEGTVLVRYIDERPKYQLIEWELLWLCSRGISHWMSVPTPPEP